MIFWTKILIPERTYNLYSHILCCTLADRSNLAMKSSQILFAEALAYPVRSFTGSYSLVSRSWSEKYYHNSRQASKFMRTLREWSHCMTSRNAQDPVPFDWFFDSVMAFIMANFSRLWKVSTKSKTFFDQECINISELNANCFCASLLRNNDSHATSFIERAP